MSLDVDQPRANGMTIEVPAEDWQHRMAGIDSKNPMIMTEVTDIVKTSRRANKASHDRLFAGKLQLGDHTSAQTRQALENQINNAKFNQPVGLERFKPKTILNGLSERSPRESCDEVGTRELGGMHERTESQPLLPSELQRVQMQMEADMGLHPKERLHQRVEYRQLEIQNHEIDID